jgi:glycosyltransferase involved in cell wall biosynthesis
VDGHRFCPDAEVRTRIRQELGIATDEFCIGSVGALSPVKDHMTVLRAFDRVSQTCRARLLVLGEGPERNKLETFVHAHTEWGSQVIFLGTSNRVTEMLNAMDVYVLPSISEGISNSLLEAMSTGLPVVATATGGNPEVVVDRESGLLFAVGDAERLAERLLELSARQDLRVQLGQQALRRVQEKFSIESMVRNYAQMYENLVPAAATPLRAAAGA